MKILNKEKNYSENQAEGDNTFVLLLNIINHKRKIKIKIKLI